jgi:hypothetical protein
MRMDPDQLHLIEWLKRIQTSWSLSPSDLSHMTSIPEAELQHHFGMTREEIAELPSIPSGLESAAGLVGLYRLLLTVYPTAEEQLKWLELPNSIFEGRKPIEVIAMSPAHLAYVTYTVESGLRLGPKTGQGN